MTKNRPIIEDFLSWRGLPVSLTLIATIASLIIYLSQQNARIGTIEKDHQIFGDQYREQLLEIKASILRTEIKLDKLTDRFIK